MTPPWPSHVWTRAKRWFGDRVWTRGKQWFGDRAERRALAFVAAVAATAAIVLVIVLAFPGPESNTVPYEVVRVCVQVLGVSVVGFFVGWATFMVQQAHLERQRRDDRIRAFLTEMLDAYHGIKQVRRLLKAETAPRTAPTITAEAYSRLIPELSKHQLVFETLARRARLIEDYMPGDCKIEVKKAGPKICQVRGPVTATLTKHYDNIEHYVNVVVSEFEECYRFTPKTGRISLAKLDLEKTIGFIYDKDEFRAEVSRRIKAIVKFLEATLLTASKKEAMLLTISKNEDTEA
ncbi:hypothetical protein [Streptomyces phaeochromogenes]|uniref:hypothetical protein n=1 Tax=Streptomyces phaeochromogenes TaxID=1923 RepID=UPI002DDAF82E|nr:hypothetical protein [Streptomyces phaeochromogenes]WRZ31706.1 hypothetical protein OG931_30195 [Streptomyces phaeochromogenes]